MAFERARHRSLKLTGQYSLMYGAHLKAFSRVDRRLRSPGSRLWLLHAPRSVGSLR
jgi:hypothetical protein